jgi:ferredoxin
MAMNVHFVARDGTIRTVVAVPGDRLLDAAQADGQPLEGTCEGQLACATCHVIVDPDDFARLPPASEDEEDMLDLAPGATRTSRIWQALDGLTVQIP